MSDFPHGKGEEETRAWLGVKRFPNVFVGWDADALLGARKKGVLLEFQDARREGERLWGLLNTARSNRGISERFLFLLSIIMLSFFYFTGLTSMLG